MRLLGGTDSLIRLISKKHNYIYIYIHFYFFKLFFLNTFEYISTTDQTCTHRHKSSVSTAGDLTE